MDNSAFEPGYTYTPVLAPDGETVYLDNIDAKQLTGGIAETQLSSDAVNNDFSNTDQGPTQSYPTMPKISNLKILIPKPGRGKGTAGPQLKAVDTFVNKYSPPYDPTKSGEGVRVIVDSYIYPGGGKLFGWLVGKFGPGLGPLLPKIIRKTPNINPEEEVVWVRTNAKGIRAIYREFEEAFYGQGKGEFLKYSEAIAKKAVEKLEQYYKIRGLPYPLAPKL